MNSVNVIWVFAESPIISSLVWQQGRPLTETIQHRYKPCCWPAVDITVLLLQKESHYNSVFLWLCNLLRFLAVSVQNKINGRGERPACSNAKRRTLLALLQERKKPAERYCSGVIIGAVPLVPPKAKAAHYTPLLTAGLSKAADTLCIMILYTSISPFIGKPNQCMGGGRIKEWNVALITPLLCISCSLWLHPVSPCFFSLCLFLPVPPPFLEEIVLILFIDRQIPLAWTHCWVLLRGSLM